MLMSLGKVTLPPLLTGCILWSHSLKSLGEVGFPPGWERDRLFDQLGFPG